MFGFAATTTGVVLIRSGIAVTALVASATAFVGAAIFAVRRRRRLRSSIEASMATLMFLVGLDAGLNAVLPQRHAKPTPSIEEQIDVIGSDADQKGYRIEHIGWGPDQHGNASTGDVKKVAFRPGARQSFVMLLSPKDPKSDASDELRIYELDTRGRLKPKFQFRPEPDQQTNLLAIDLRPHLASKRVPGKPQSFSLQLRPPRDLNGSAGSEMIVDISENAVRALWPRPTYVQWDVATRTYKLRAILTPETTGRPTMSGVITKRYLRPMDDYARELLNHVYTRPTRIVDGTNVTPAMSSYAVEAYVVQPERIQDPRRLTGGGIVLTAGYVVRGVAYGSPDLLQVVRWHLNLRQDPITAKASMSSLPPIKVGSNASRLTTLLARATP